MFDLSDVTRNHDGVPIAVINLEKSFVERNFQFNNHIGVLCGVFVRVRHISLMHMYVANEFWCFDQDLSIQILYWHGNPANVAIC